MAEPESKIFWRIVLIGLVASLLSNFFLIFTAPIDNHFPFIPRYSLFQYLFSYQDLGFVRRALVGSLLNLPNDAAFVWQVYLIAVGQYAALLVFMAYWINRHGDPGFAWIFVLSPATFLQVGYDFGRLDAFFILVTGLCLMSRSRWPILILPVIVLIHEGSIVISAPLIVLAHVYRFGFSAPLVLSVCLAVGLIGWFTINTQILAVPVSEVYTSLQDNVDILGLSFSENVAFAANYYSEMLMLMTVVPFFMYLHVLAALYILAILVYVARSISGGWWGNLLLVSCCTPLLLIPIGIDLGRWGALTVFNLFLLHLAWAHWEGPERRPHTALPSLRFAALWLFILLGPFAIGRPFPFARMFLTNLHLSAG
ncbi:MAG: hypothetical protein AAGC81_03465 [Pseudomonadota bacterium]